MRTKSILIAVVFMVCAALSSLMFIHPSTQADSVNTVSYQTIENEHKNDIPAVPVRLMIPTAKIDANIEQVGLAGDKMDVPSKIEDVGWYEYGYRPGEKGNAVIDGHLDAADGSPAAFWRLGLLRENDSIYVKDKNEKQYHFVVTSVQEYPDAQVPLTTLFTKSLTSNLVLITCAGDWDTGDHNYTKRLIVSATLMDEE